MNLDLICESLRKASQKLALENAERKNKVLLCVAEELDKNRNSIISANKIDIENARSNGMSESIIDRLMFFFFKIKTANIRVFFGKKILKKFFSA